MTTDDTSRFLSLFSFHGLRKERLGPHSPFWRTHTKKMRRLHFQSKKDELELDVRIRHYHSATKTNNVNHRNTAYSLKYPENTFELKLLGETSFEQKLKHKKERVSKTSVLHTTDFCDVVSTLLFRVSFGLESGSQVERQKRQKT